MKQQFTRRQVLGAGGSLITLPLLPSLARAAPSAPSLPNAVFSEGGAPKRLIFLNFGYGPSKSFYPQQSEPELILPEGMQPLERHRETVSFMSNLTNIETTQRGTHWGATTFLTGANLARTPGRAFHNSISCDQVAAKMHSPHVRFPSLVLSAPTDDVEGVGPGASLSWDADGNPIHGESDHVTVFNQLFGGTDLAKRRHAIDSGRSVLDAIRINAGDVSKRLGRVDRQRMDQYFTSIRAIEKGLARDESWLDKPLPKAPFAKPEPRLSGTPAVNMMFDLMVAALQTDLTRVVTYRLPTPSLLAEFSEETGAGAVVSHPMTHYRSTDTDEYRALLWRDRKVSDLLATLLDKLKETRDVDGRSILDNTLVVMGSDIRTAHIRNNVPILFAGGGGGGVRQGRHYVYKESETRLSNLWLGMLKHVGCPVESFSDGTDPLTEMFT
jgi:hypothetical protein